MQYMQRKQTGIDMLQIRIWDTDMTQLSSTDAGRENFEDHTSANRFAFDWASKIHVPDSSRSAGMEQLFDLRCNNMLFIFHHFLLPLGNACISFRIFAIYL